MATYSPDSRGRCPHCLTVVRFENGEILDYGRSAGSINLAGSKEELGFTIANCPDCGKLVLTVETGKRNPTGVFVAKKKSVVWPLHSARPVPKEVPPHIASDYKEAASLLHLSPKASAALSRRCLQTVLREKGKASQRDLSKQIDTVMPSLPGYIAKNIDAIRNIGNFAAHPIKSQTSGEIVDVEPGEAGWNLDVLDQLFDFYYVQPLQAQQKRKALNAKLKAAGRPPMK